MDLSKLHVPKFYNLHNKSVENLLYECAIDPLSSYAIIIDNKDSNHKFYSYDSLASKLVFNRSFEINKKSGIIKYQHDLLHAHDMLGNPILAIDIPDFQSMQLEMDFHLRYDGEIGIMHIPYIVSIYDIKSMKENFGDSIDYLRVRNSTMRLFYKDFYDKHNRDSVRTQADVLAFFIVDDTTIVVSNPEFFNIDEKDSESLYKRGNDYLISKNEKMKWIVFIVFTVLYWCLMIYVVIIAIILGRFYYKSKRFPKNLELKKIARIKWRTLYIVLAFFISYAPVYLYIVHKLY